MNRTLLTGFGAFRSVRSNPSQRLVEHFVAAPPPDTELTGLVLPVSYALAPNGVIEAICSARESNQPFDVVLMMGVAGKREYWSVERCAHNRCSGADADGAPPPGCVIRADSPEMLEVSMAVEPIVAAVNASGLRCVASSTAGEYLCNYVLFHTLDWLRRSGDVSTRVGFLHIPADIETFDRSERSAARIGFGSLQVAALACFRAIAGCAPDAATRGRQA